MKAHYYKEMQYMRSSRRNQLQCNVLQEQTKLEQKEVFKELYRNTIKRDRVVCL
jgi:ribosomal protein L23